MAVQSAAEAPIAKGDSSCDGFARSPLVVTMLTAKWHLLGKADDLFDSTQVDPFETSEQSYLFDLFGSCPNDPFGTNDPTSTCWQGLIHIDFRNRSSQPLRNRRYGPTSAPQNRWPKPT